MRKYVFERFDGTNGEETVYRLESEAWGAMFDTYAHLTREEWAHMLEDDSAVFRVYGVDIPPEALEAYTVGESVNLLNYEIPGTDDNPLERTRARLAMDDRTRVCAEMLDSITGAWNYATADDVAKAWEHGFITDHDIDGETYYWYLDPDGVEMACDEVGNTVSPKWIVKQLIK